MKMIIGRYYCAIVLSIFFFFSAPASGRDVNVVITIAQAEEFWRTYRATPPNLLEKILNYTNLGIEEGEPGNESPLRGLNHPWTGSVWLSGMDGEHKCILTKVFVGGGFGGSREYRFVIMESVDLRNFNQSGFRIRRGGSGQGYIVGDERRTIHGSSNAVLERLQNAWGLAFQECPGRRSAF